jgi:hypothetical protein
MIHDIKVYALARTHSLSMSGSSMYSVATVAAAATTTFCDGRGGAGGFDETR